MLNAEIPAGILWPMRISLPVLLLITLLLAACSRQFAVSVNERVLFDPRGAAAVSAFTDPGLQSCVNLRLQHEDYNALDDINILSCANLEIRSLEGIETLRRLTFLDVGGNELTHLDALRRVPGLVSIRAPDNPLNNIEALLDLRSLTSAVLTGADAIPCSQLDALQQRLGADLVRPSSCAP